MGADPGYDYTDPDSPVFGFLSPLPCGPSPGDDPFEWSAVIYFVLSPPQKILLLALDVRFPLSTASHHSRMGILCFVFFLPPAPFYFCARYLRSSDGEAACN